MGEFLKNLAGELNQLCPTFTQVPQHTPYPYITLEGEQILQGVPWGPSMMILSLKIWSRYAGTQEILKIAKNVEEFLNAYCPPALQVSLKILESSLLLLKDGQTRIHCFRLKARISGGSQ